jgi:hypothetical protein
MIYWQLFKLAITNVAGFVTKYWQFVLVAVLLITSFVLYQKLDAIQFEYEQHLAGDAKAMADRKLENYFKEKAHAKDIEDAHAERIALTEKFNLDRKRYTKEIKDLYANKTNSEFRLNSYADWLRLEQERKAANRLPDTESDTSALAEGWRKCDAAFTTLEQACRITTLDYNELRKWGDSSCNTVGCK